MNCPSEFQYWFLYFSAHDGLIISVIHHVANWWPSILETNHPPQTIHICLHTLTFQQRFVLMPATVNYSAALPQTRVWLAPLKVSNSNSNIFPNSSLSLKPPEWKTPSLSSLHFCFLVLAPLLQWEKRHKCAPCDFTKGPHYISVEFFG